MNIFKRIISSFIFVGLLSSSLNLNSGFLFRSSGSEQVSSSLGNNFTGITNQILKSGKPDNLNSFSPKSSVLQLDIKPESNNQLLLRGLGTFFATLFVLGFIAFGVPAIWKKIFSKKVEVENNWKKLLANLPNKNAPAKKEKLPENKSLEQKKQEKELPGNKLQEQKKQENQEERKEATEGVKSEPNVSGQEEQIPGQEMQSEVIKLYEPGQDPKELEKTRQLNKKVETLFGWAKENKRLKHYLCQNESIEVGRTKNDVYQIKVERQVSSSCGPRALFYAKTLKDYFSDENKDGSQYLSIIKDNLLVDNALGENGNLRKFFGQAINTLKDKFQDAQEYKNEEFVSKAVINSGKKEPAKVKNPKYGKIDPINLDSRQISSLADDLQISDNISCIDGYDAAFEIFRDDYFGKMAKNREIGNCHGFIITEGLNERGTSSAESVGHWFCLFGIKIEENRYAWFVIDSLNKGYLNKEEDGYVYKKIVAYIHKFLGSDSYKDYDEQIITWREEINKNNREKFELFSGKIKALKDCLQLHENFIKTSGKEGRKFSIPKKEGLTDIIKKDLEIKEKEAKITIGNIRSWIEKHKLLTSSAQYAEEVERAALKNNIDSLLNGLSKLK